MALSIVNDNSGTYSYVINAWVGQSTPEFLGLKDLSTFISLGNGGIAIGFDTRVSPAQVRIFYDVGTNTSLASGRFSYGLVMTSQILFDNLPILPGVFSEAVAYKNAYSDFINVETRKKQKVAVSPAFTVDMMSADKLHSSDPYYAYNSLDLSKAFSINNPSGFLANYPGAQTINTPLCASLCAPIGIDIDAPLISDLDEMIKDFKDNGIDPIATCSTQGNLLANALQTLNLTTDKILNIQMFGGSPLITVTDTEGYYPVLFVDGSNGAIYSLEINLIEALQYKFVSDIFENFVDYTVANQYSNNGFPSRQGYFTRSYKQNSDKRYGTMLSGGEHFIGTIYKIYFVGFGDMSQPDNSKRTIYSCLNGVEWKVKRQFDKSTVSFGPLQISTPEILKWTDIIKYNQEIANIDLYLRNLKNSIRSYRPELINFLQAYSNKVPGSPNQAQWFNTYIPLPPTINSVSDNNTVFSVL